MIKHILLMTAITSVLSCSHPELGGQALDLENFNLNFDVDKFYAPAIEKAKLYSGQREEIIAGKKKEDFGDKLIDPWSFETIAIDSVFVDDIFAPSKQLVGLQYNMNSWTQGDSLARYGNMYFEAMNMMRTEEGQFIAFVASNQQEGEEPFKQLLAEIEGKHGKPKVTGQDFFGNYKVYSWQLEDRLLAVSSKYNDKSNELKLALELDSMKADTTKHHAIDSKLFIVSNVFRDSLMGNLKSGAWLYFDKLTKE